MPADTPETRLALAALDALDASESLFGGVAKRPDFAEVYAYVSDPAYQPGPGFLDALQRDSKLKMDVRRLMANLSQYALPRSAAAASGEMMRRDSGGVLLEMMASKARSSHAYLVVTLRNEQNRRPSRLSLMSDDGTVVHLRLPDFDGAETQVILEFDSVAYRLFGDPMTEVFLA